MTTGQYETEVITQLSNSEHYQTIDSDTTPEIARQIHETINKYVSKSLLKEETAQAMIPNPYRVEKFYLLPKIPKT